MGAAPLSSLAGEGWTTALADQLCRFDVGTIGVAAWCFQPSSDPGGPDEVGPELNASAGNFSVRTQLRTSKFESVLGPLVGIKKVTNMWGRWCRNHYILSRHRIANWLPLVDRLRTLLLAPTAALRATINNSWRAPRDLTFRLTATCPGLEEISSRHSRHRDPEDGAPRRPE